VSQFHTASFNTEYRVPSPNFGIESRVPNVAFPSSARRGRRGVFLIFFSRFHRPWVEKVRVPDLLRKLCREDSVSNDWIGVPMPFEV
jgi:hypothetical protein